MFKSLFQHTLLATFTILFFTGLPTAQLIAMEPEMQESSGSVIGLGKLFVCGAASAGMGWLWYSHYNTLHEYEAALDRSTIAQSAKGHDFRFATWRSHNDNAIDHNYWDTARALWMKSDQVCKTLLHDAQVPGRIYINGVVVALEFRQVMPSIREAIVQERQLFEEQLAYVAQFTDVPVRIIEECREDDNRMVSMHALALACAKDLRIHKHNFDAFQTETLEALENASKIKYVVHAPSWWPTTWAFLPCYQKASRVYFKLFKAYARLLALEAALEEEKSF